MRNWDVVLSTIVVLVIGTRLGYTHLSDWWVYAVAGGVLGCAGWALRRLVRRAH